MKKLLSVGIIILLVCVGIPSTGRVMEKSSTLSSDGKTLYVGGVGPNNYTNIQDAINDSSNGDTVFVFSGTYFENLVIDKSIILIGEDKENTIIDGQRKICIKVTVDNITITKFTLTNALGFPQMGIWADKVDNCTFSDNIIYSNYYGIQIYGSHNQITNNIIYYNTNIAIYVPSGDFNTIVDNIIYSNNNWSIYLYNSRWNQGHNIIINNSISDNYGGIKLRYSPNNTINLNTIENNTEGIKLLGGIHPWEKSINNVIYHNNFFNNTLYAYDEGNNSWDNGYPSGGNYWDDYNGTDIDGDGIGDTPYKISGGTNQDRYPLMDPYINETKNFFGTIGPICPFLNIAEIELIDGNESQIGKIEKMLNNRILHFIIPRMYFINVVDLNFSISYTKKIPKLPFWWNFEYMTIITENGSLTDINIPHKVTVKGFNGDFTIIRGRLFIIYPPHFIFAGVCEEVTIEYLNGIQY